MANKITMELIKELREKTQVGMMDCKKALISADGDIERAIEILRKKGASVAAKRAENVTNNGRIASYISDDYKTGTLLEVGCETDFSANTLDMQNFTQTIAEHLAKAPQCCPEWCDTEKLLEQKVFNDETKTIQTLLDELIAKIAENIRLSQCARFDAPNGLVNAYIHPGATLAVMIELDVEGLTDANREAVAQLAKDVCMQVAVNNPLCVDPSQLDKEVIAKEECFIKEQLKASGKPDELIEKIVPNKLKKYYEDVCLINQKYIKNDKVSVQEHINEVAKNAGCTINVKQYKRFAIGK